MLLNYKLKKCFLLLIICVILLLIIIAIYLSFIENKINQNNYFKERLKFDLSLLFENTVNELHLKPNYSHSTELKIEYNNLKCYLDLSFLELDFLSDELNKKNIILNNIDIFYTEFLNYIKNKKNKIFINNCLFKTCHFINDMPSIVKHKYNYILKQIKNNNSKIKNIIVKKKFEEYIYLLGIFLANYKHVEKNNKFINKFTKKYNFIKNQGDFKKALVFTWKLGSFICDQINKKNIPKFEIKIFDNYVELFIKMCSKQKGFPLGYDWFLFASHYPTILSYKLFIDYKIKNIILEKYILEILKYIPNINYSKHIKRYKSNAAILSINYIIAHLFKFHYKINIFYDFIENILNSDIYKNDIIIQYQEPLENQFIDGLYFDGGFIIHKNLVSYNYLTAYLYPSLFYKILFNQETGNIHKILDALTWLIIPNKNKTSNNISFRNINPVIISRYGKFNEIQNTLSEFINNYTFMDNNLDYKKYINLNLKNILGIKVIESSRLVIANFLNWSIQIKINSELAYGEIDIYNKQILKQISMNKIMFFDDINDKYKELSTHSIYPGVLSYKQFLNNAEQFHIKHGTQTYLFNKVQYAFIQLDKNTIIIYSTIINNELKLSYEELILINEYGIFVGYFNIFKMLLDDLFLTIETDLINKYVKSGILFSDDTTSLIKKNDSIIKKVNKHVLYYNHILSAPISTANINLDNNNEIKIIIKFDRTYYINLNKLSGVYAYFAY